MAAVNLIGVAAKGARAARREIASEIVAVVRGLESDQVVIREAAEDLFMHRQRLQDVRRGARRVQEKADAVAVTARAQFPAEKHQMVVVHPDDVVLADKRAQAVGELPVDADIAAGVGARKLLHVATIVEDRP